MSEKQEITREVYVNGVSVEMNRFQIREAIDDLQDALDSIHEELNDQMRERSAVSDPMTDGAERGTDELPEWAINAAEKVMLRISQDRPEAALAMIGKSYIAAQIIVDECPLTEALKVAGELDDEFANHHEWCPAPDGRECTCGLSRIRAALERIRNQSKP